MFYIELGQTDGGLRIIGVEMRAVDLSAFNATRVCSTTRAAISTRHMQLEHNTIHGVNSNYVWNIIF